MPAFDALAFPRETAGAVGLPSPGRAPGNAGLYRFDEPQPWEPLLTRAERAALDTAPWLAALPPAVRHEIVRHCRVRNLRANESLNTAGDGPALCGVASGALGIRLRQPCSEILDHCPAGAWLVDASRLAACSSPLVLEAHRRATVVTMPAEVLAGLLRRHGGLQQPVAQIGWGLVARLLAILEDCSALPLKQRLARCLLRLVGHFGQAEDEGMRIAQAINQTEMALMVRASRQRLNLELNGLEALGVLKIGKELLITDLPALRAMS